MGAPAAGLPSIVHELALRAEARPDAPAFIFLDRGEAETARLSYGALARRARGIARFLRAEGLAGKTLLLAYPPGLEAIAVLFGCLWAGAAVIMAAPGGSGAAWTRLEAILADGAAAALLTDRKSLAAGAAALPALTIPAITTDEIGPDDDGGGPAASMTGLALLQYTSGSTGRPRGVMISHANLAHNLRALDAAYGLGESDTGVSWLPLHHDMGLIGGVLQPLHAGYACVLMPPLAFLQQPRRWLRAISTYQASASPAPCFGYELCTRRPAEPGLDLSHWRVAICGSEPVERKVLQLFADTYREAGFNSRAFRPSYGMAEATLLAAAGEGMDASGERVACGPPHGCELAIVTPRTRKRVPENGQSGEIWLRGPSISSGYWGRPEETAQHFAARLAGEPDGGWLRTGDLGHMGPAGLVVTGRIKDCLIIRGVNFDPLEIEREACMAVPEMAASAAFAISSSGGEAAVLLLEPARLEVKALDAGTLAARVVEAVHLRFGLRLHDLVLVRPRGLPRTTSGKLQRFLCREHYLAGTLPALLALDHPGLGRSRGRTA